MSVESILESIEKLTLLEAAELVKAMEEKFGVSAAAPVAVAAVAAAPAEAAAEEAAAEEANKQAPGNSAEDKKPSTDVVPTDVKKDAAEGLYYDTQKFEEIALQGDAHVGSDDFRDAFRGTVVSEVSADIVEATVEMGRPMAKFNFVSVDVEDFIVKVASEGIFPTGEGVDLSNYKAVFRYQGFMPYSYNMFTDKPADSKVGV